MTFGCAARAPAQRRTTGLSDTGPQRAFRAPEQGAGFVDVQGVSTPERHARGAHEEYRPRGAVGFTSNTSQPLDQSQHLSCENALYGSVSGTNANRVNADVEHFVE